MAADHSASPTNHSRTTTRAGLALLVMVAGSAGGCYTPGGPQRSIDQYTYQSTSWLPKTITVIDTRTGQAIFTQDVPVGYELVMNFKPGDGDGTQAYPDALRWDIWSNDQTAGEFNEANVIFVPAAENRRVDMTLRKAPELPPEMMDPDHPPSPIPPPKVDGPQALPGAPVPPAPPAPPGPPPTVAPPNQLPAIPPYESTSVIGGRRGS